MEQVGTLICLSGCYYLCLNSHVRPAVRARNTKCAPVLSIADHAVCLGQLALVKGDELNINKVALFTVGL